MTPFDLTILAATRPVYEGKCESIVIPENDGQYGIQAHHRNVIMAIVPGIIKYRVSSEQEPEILAVSNGMVKVEDNTVLVLVDTAEHPDEIDAIRLQQEIDDAKEVMLQKNSMREYESARFKLRRELSRLSAKNYRDMY